jgi:predicted lipid-binding transport protein (Tim44 family)
MITRGDLIWLGVASGVCGGLIGGLMLGIGMVLMYNGSLFGMLLILPGAPASCIVGYVMARRLARQLG